MRRSALTLLMLALGAGFLAAPLAVHAGFCEGTTSSGVAWCCNDSELVYEAGQLPSTGCTDGRYQDGSFVCPASKTCSGRMSTTAAKDTKDCCFYAQGNWLAPNSDGQCKDVSGLPTGQHLGQACDTLTQCTGKPQEPTIVGSSSTAPIRFKPQLAIPGSELFNGQEIIITGSTLGEYIAALYVFVVSAIGILAALLIMYGGLKWLTAGGDRGRVQDAKDQIASAVIGILLTFGAYLLLLIISPKLVKFNSLFINPIPKREAAYESEVAFGARGGGLGSASLAAIGDWLNNPTTGIATLYDSTITPLANSQVPRDLIYAIIFVESGGRPSLVSSAGACGIMQLLPATAGKTCQQLLDPTVGINAGVAYLKKLASDTCPATAVRRDGSVAKCKPPDVQDSGCQNGDLTYVTAAYNGGQGANCGSVDCPGQTWWLCTAIEGYQETRDYVLKVQAARAAIQPLL